MCPLYKKKDRTEISNYRPITLLNTDYKILTKVLALQLVEEIQNMLHQDQTGFVPGRSIFNNIRLASTIIEYAELTESNGAIMALDQEKVYDKIRHDYLWKTLERFNVPHTFVRTVQELYKHAHTQIVINGILSQPFKVTRGVQQGDPLSCALFNLAIEPLACRIHSDENLEGYKIPGTEEKIIISLYADDTNLFLNQNDNMDYIHKILEEWCKASGAKFNIEKTEIIPIGNQEHRLRMTTTRKLNNNEITQLDDRIKIAEDQEAIRILGAWLGNKTNASAPWEPIIDKINKALTRYSKSHPTLNGRKIIAQIIVRGYTQFLTQAQGMPPHIEAAITKTIKDFIWEEYSSPRIALDYLHLPIEEGGLNLLDINARNEAIEIIWLKSYLNMSPTRPTWAKMTDIIMDAAVPPSHNAQARLNTFLQTWNVPIKGARADKLPKDVTRMLKAARKHNVNFAALRLSQRLKQKLPAWFQEGANHWPINNRAAKCLLKKHNVKTIADLMKTAARLRNNPENHRHTNFCNCSACEEDNRKNCTHPHDCATEALARIQATTPKTNPLYPERHDNLSLTKRRKDQNKKAKEENGTITFDPTMTNKTDITECFRIFTDPQRLSKYPAQRLRTDPTNNRHDTVTVYTDGACINNGKANAKCGGGVWFGQNDPQNIAFRVPGKSQSNQIGELAATIVAIQKTPHFRPLEIKSDSKYVIKGLTENLHHWEDRGWIQVQNEQLFKTAAYLLKRRSAKTTFTWVKGHNGTQGNEESDKLAKEGATKEIPDDIDTSIPVEFDLQGAKLTTIDQATAYQGIRSQRSKPPCLDAQGNLQATRDAIERINGTKETDATIWTGTRKPVLRTRVQQFLYKTIHQAYKIGDKWNNVRNCEQRAICTKCGITESMQHILLECHRKARKKIWRRAKKFWPFGRQQWPEITIGTIMGVGSINLREEGQDNNEQETRSMEIKGRTRLLQILISEASHLIWVLRCEKVIQNKRITNREINARWIKKINERLTTDRITATKIKRDEKFTRLIDATWKEALRKQGIQHENWIQRKEVFSG